MRESPNIKYKAPGRPYSITWRGPTKKLERDFSQGHGVIRQGGMAFNWKRVDLG